MVVRQLPAALTAMTMGDPVSSFIWSVLLFDAVPGPDPSNLLWCAAAGCAMLTGVALLAYSPTLRDEIAARAPAPGPRPAAVPSS